MRERIEGVGGRFAIRSQPGKGTTVEMNVPLHPAAARLRETTSDQRT
jgi:chemotaxis protein histidine kinase CheA